MEVDRTAIELEPQDSPDHPLAPWFAKARRERRERYASRSRRKLPRRRAIITIVNNEAVLFPIWLRYYAQFFAPDDIYVLDNESTDGSTRQDGFKRIPVVRDGLDNLWMVGQVQQLQHELLDDDYDLVVVTDVDEIVAPTPAHGTLGQYLDRFDEEWVNCLGYEVIHWHREPPLRLDRSILSQRGYWFYDDIYDKPAVATVPMAWRPGFHGRSDFHFNLEPDLRLIHLHRMDYEICHQRHRVRSGRKWAELDAREGWGAHNFITEEAEFRRWFYGKDQRAEAGMRIERIPPSWLTVL